MFWVKFGRPARRRALPHKPQAVTELESSWVVRIPGKTFFVGEYLALFGGPSLVMTTSPCFEFSWRKSDVKPPAGRGFQSHPFHPDSPAGRKLSKQPSDTEYTVQFKDPYLGQGGLGASTAEFAGAWAFEKFLRARKSPAFSSVDFDYQEILENYRATFSPEEKSGSGADLVSQVAGGIACWDARSGEMTKFDWPFEDLQATLLLTGKKLKTHEHLMKLEWNESSQGVRALRSWVDEAIRSFREKDSALLVASVRGFGEVLKEQRLVTDTTLDFLRDLSEIQGVRAAKGCGAMGSDVLLILHDESAIESVMEFREKNGLKMAATSRDVWTDSLCIVRS